MTERLPLFPLGTILFPGMLLPLHVFEERYRRLMRDREGREPIFGVVLTRRGREVGDRPEMYRVGTAATLVGAGRYPDGRYDVVVIGGRRFSIEGGDWEAGYFTGTIDWLDEPESIGSQASALAPLVADAAREYRRFLASFERVTGTGIAAEELPERPDAFAYAICARLPLDNRVRQALLECDGPEDRLRRLVAALRHERALLDRTGIGGSGVPHPGARLLPN